MRIRAALLFCSTLALTPLAAFSQQVIPLWPHAAPESITTTGPEADVTKPTDGLINGKRTARLANVTQPTITLYQPSGHEPHTGTAALVFPGGGYQRLAWDGEGIATCQWLNSAGITCLLVKYRVPTKGHYPDNYIPLEDAQQAMRLAKLHAKDWKIDSGKIGVVGFSAGGNLAALMSTHPDDAHVLSSPAAPDVPLLNGKPIDARAAFAVLVYPAYLIAPLDPTDTKSLGVLDPVYTPNDFTPPTFLIQAENDRGYGKNAPVYYQALAAAKVPAELHMYATGGHGFGIHPPGAPEEHWTDIANAWFRYIGVLPTITPDPATGSASPGQAPCPMPQPPSPGNPNNNQPTSTRNTNPSTNPNCL